MNFFRKLFAKKTADQSLPAPASKDKGVIKVFDQYGREVALARDVWRTSVLPANIKSNWNNPDALYNIITSALGEGFRSEVFDAAEHLFRIDPNRERAVIIWGIVLREQGDLDRAQRVFEEFLATNPAAGYVLTHLAMVHDRRGNPAKAEETLWQGLTADPNQDHGLSWYLALHNERGGEREGLKACRRVAAVPDSWRAQLWMARDALKAGDKSEALTLYGQALANAGSPAPEPLLMQMSGDLGGAGHIRDLVSLTEPAFDVALHGLNVGNNLIKAHIELGDADRAAQIVEQLYAQKRPDWKQTLSYWDTEIAKARIAADPGPPEVSTLTMLAIDGPVWLDAKAPAARLFPPKSRDDFLLGFLAGTVTVNDAPDEPQRQLADPLGRVSRAIPLLLSEHIHFSTRAQTQALFPWISGRGGFALFGKRFSDEEAIAQIVAPADGPAPSPMHSLIVPHIDARQETWLIEVRILRPSDGRCLGRVEQPLHSRMPTNELKLLCDRVLRSLVDVADIHLVAPPPTYRPPMAGHLNWYATCLEQLLAVRCAGMEERFADTLHGPRDIIDGMINLCLQEKDNPTFRMLLAQTIRAMKKARPEIIPEFREKLTALQSEGRLPPDVKAVADEMIKEALA